jgi:hypothetical protein
MYEVATYIYVCLFDASSVVQDLEYAPLLFMIIQLDVENFARRARFGD